MFGFLAPILGALGGASGLVSIASGIAQARAARASRSSPPSAQGVDYQRLVADAKAAGFNPLTALMAGGGAGYQREFAPALSSGSFIADAVGRAIDTGYNRKQDRDALTMAINDREYQRQQQLARAAAVPTRRFGYSLTDVQPYGGLAAMSSFSKGALSGENSGSTSQGLAWGERGALPVRVFGYNVKQADTSNSSIIEDRYGDLVQSAYGLSVLPADVASSARQSFRNSFGYYPEMAFGHLKKPKLAYPSFGYGKSRGASGSWPDRDTTTWSRPTYTGAR